MERRGKVREGRLTTCRNTRLNIFKGVGYNESAKCRVVVGVTAMVVVVVKVMM